MLANRKEFVHLILVAVVLGFGIEFIASSIFEVLREKAYYFLAIGVLLLFGSIAYLCKLAFSTRSFNAEYAAFLVFDPKTNTIVPVRDYAFSERFIGR
jgi:hypothetical protein